jgi:predicted MPP superfamily phosphohydrolase
MKICLLSDLHLDFHFDGGVEFVRFLTIPEDCDLTIVAGDLCQADHWRWHQSIQEICQKSKQVLYVLGNHQILPGVDTACFSWQRKRRPVATMVDFTRAQRILQVCR